MTTYSGDFCARFRELLPLHALGVPLGNDDLHAECLPPDADGLVEVFDEFFPDVRPPRCVSKLGVDRPGLLVSIAMVAVIG